MKRTISTVSEESLVGLQERIHWLYIFLTLFFILITFRLWYLQIIKGDELRQYSLRNLIKETKIQAPRGIFLDREGKILVKNKVGFQLTLKPQFAVKKEETLQALAPILKLNVKKTLKEIQKSEKQHGPFEDFILKSELSFDEVAYLKRTRFLHPGLSVKPIILRKYPLNENGAQLFGYVGEISKSELKAYRKSFATNFEPKDIVGKGGLEKEWETVIRGKSGAFYEEVDALGRGQLTPFLGLENKPPVQGHHLVLTIDKDLQQIAFESMKRNDAIGERIGALVAMKSNGEILAWVSLPSFNANDFTEKIEKDVWLNLTKHPYKPFRNKVIQDHYPPGSSLKPFVALVGLEESLITPEKKILSPGYISFGRRRYHDHKKGGHGLLNLHEAIERSSNTFFYKLGMKMDIDRVAHFASLFNLGKKTGIKLRPESTGFVPSKKGKLKSTGEPWQPGENLSHAIGQGFWLLTPLQMAVLFNTLALEGQVYQPFLVKEIRTSKEEVLKKFQPQLVRTIKEIDKKHFQAIKKGMFQVANGPHGTARWWKLSPYKKVFFAGKTGTVQLSKLSASEVYKKCETLSFNKRHHGWFAGYAPHDKPEISVAVLTEHSCHGSTGSAPIVRDVIRGYLKKYRPELLQKGEPSA